MTSGWALMTETPASLSINISDDHWVSLADIDVLHHDLLLAVVSDLV